MTEYQRIYIYKYRSECKHRN